MKALHYYVYYRVDPARLDDLGAAVEALFGEVRAATGVQGRLQRRRDDPSTFMEIYVDVTDALAFESALAAALVNAGFARIVDHRKTEIFQCA